MVEARELEAAYALLRDADATLQVMMAAGAVLEHNSEVMLALLREAKWLLGTYTPDHKEWATRRDAFLNIRLPDRS